MDTLVDSYLSTPFNYQIFDSEEYEGRYRDDDRSSPSSGDSLEHQVQGEGEGDGGDLNDPMLKFLSQMLMEEDHLENQPCMFHDCLAALAAEKSFSDLLNHDDHHPLSPYVSDQENTLSPNGNSTSTCATDGSSYDVNQIGVFGWNVDQSKFNPSSVCSNQVNMAAEYIPQPTLEPYTYTDSYLDAVNEMDESLMSLVQKSVSSVSSTPSVESSLLPDTYNISNYLDSGNTLSGSVLVEKDVEETLLRDSFDNKKNHGREDDGGEQHRSSKVLASYEEDPLTFETYDNVLLSRHLNPHFDPEPSSEDALKVEARNKLLKMEQSVGSTRGRARKGRGRRPSVEKEVVDLRNLLLQCAQSIATNDHRSTNELLKKIRQHSSPNGDGTERAAHYVANALDARLAGTGTAVYESFNNKSITAAHILPAYKVFLAACPFKKVSSMFANKTILKLASKATRLHIIDFGILYGFQWPCLIQSLSVRPEGPPMLHITGIDLPQSGFRPAGRVEETGLRLANYCERFGVPFEYNAIAKKWDTIQIEDFKINNDELLVVNCLDRLSHVPDETVTVDTSPPRDKVLQLIRKLHPALFILGVANGTYSSPFFVTRFREALYHFSARFDMFEATVARDSPERALYEREVIGRDAINVIACEGTERVDRPETYKQWQVRASRAGFKQIPPDREIQKLLTSKVKQNYHKDFSVDEDKCWVLQGWKGRVATAVSSWVPI